MNKRGQIYILAAIVLCVAIYGVIKITNKIEPPIGADNFDFYVENFVGERAYVMDLGYFDDGPGAYLTNNYESNNLLELFTRMGFNVGVVLVDYEEGNTDNEGTAAPWRVVNYLSSNIIIDGIVINPAQEPIGDLSFKFGDGKNYQVSITELGDLYRGDRYFVKSFSGDEIDVDIDGSVYNFKKPASDRVESIIFKNLDKDYIKVVRI